MYIGHAALGTKNVPGLYAPGTRGRADLGVILSFVLDCAINALKSDVKGHRGECLFSVRFDKSFVYFVYLLLF